MAIMLGNLDVSEIQNRLGVTFSDEDVKKLNDMKCENAKVEQEKWHCFDIPFMIICGGIETRDKVINILSPYAEQFKTTIQVASDN